MDKLRTYLNGKIKREFAEAIGVSPTYLSQILGGWRRPSLELAVKIERITNGEVPCSAWVDGDAPADAKGQPAG